jgi:tRNA G18 (ribose-2'-O)-methylase SpoU
MVHYQNIASLDLPELAPYRTMRRQQEHRDQRIFVAEGDKVVHRLLESQFKVLSLLVPPKWAEENRQLIESRPERIDVFVAEKKVLEELTGFSMYQGVLGVGRIPEALNLETVLRESESPRLFAAVEGVSNAENMGTLVRNCAAFGALALLVGETCTSPFVRRAVRSSMGTIFKQRVVEVESLVETLTRLRARGIRCLAAHPGVTQRSLAQASFTGDCCVLFGAEGDGLSAAALAVCDEAVAIPMHDGIDSLNVGSASAVFLYEARRQRGNG